MATFRLPPRALWRCALPNPDTLLLDWLAAQGDPLQRRWLARPSSGGIGFRLYTTSNPTGYMTPRLALIAAGAPTSIAEDYDHDK